MICRENPQGAISGRQLGEAAHRLVANSLQSSHRNYGGRDAMHSAPTAEGGLLGPPPPSYRPTHYAGHDRYSHTVDQNHPGHGYGRPYSSSYAGPRNFYPPFAPPPGFSHNADRQSRPSGRAYSQPYNAYGANQPYGAGGQRMQQYEFYGGPAAGRNRQFAGRGGHWNSQHRVNSYSALDRPAGTRAPPSRYGRN